MTNLYKLTSQNHLAACHAGLPISPKDYFLSSRSPLRQFPDEMDRVCVYAGKRILVKLQIKKKTHLNHINEISCSAIETFNLQRN